MACTGCTRHRPTVRVALQPWSLAECGVSGSSMVCAGEAAGATSRGSANERRASLPRRAQGFTNLSAKRSWSCFFLLPGSALHSHHKELRKIARRVNALAFHSADQFP